MTDLSWQLFALVLLFAAVGLSALRWLRPRASGLGAQAIGLLVLLALTLCGGFIGAFFWWVDEARAFSWDLPPLASRMLAAAGWSFALVTAMALEHPTQRRLRLLLLLLATYLTPLVVVIFLFHLDRFDFSQPVVYGFFAIAGGMTVATLWYLFRQPPVEPDPARDALPAAPIVRLWLGLVGVLTALWGLALFITDSGPSPLVWVWPGDLLTSRLIGVMLLTVAVGALYARPRADTARVMLALSLVYGLGLAAASLWNAFQGLPIKVSYLIVFSLIFLGSLALLALARQPSESA
jgi:hypothetical protein